MHNLNILRDFATNNSWHFLNTFFNTFYTLSYTLIGCTRVYQKCQPSKPPFTPSNILTLPKVILVGDDAIMVMRL